MGRRSGGTMLPVSRILTNIQNTRDLFIYCRENAVFHYAVYVGLTILHMVQAAFPAIIAWHEKVFDPNVPITQVWRLFSVFWRFGAIWTSPVALTVCWSILCGCTLLFLIPMVVGSAMYQKTGRVPVPLCYTIMFMHEVLFVLIGQWLPSQIGTIIGLIIQDPGRRTAFMYIQVVVLLFILGWDLLFTGVHTYSSFVYTRGRCMCWGSFGYVRVLLAIRIIQFLSRVMELVEGAWFYSFGVMLVLFLLFYTFYGLYVEPMLYTIVGAVMGGLAFAAVIMSICCIMIYAGVGLDTMAISVTFIVLSCVAGLVCYFWLHNRDQRTLKEIDRWAEEGMTFEECFPNSVAFIQKVRIGFRYGNTHIVNLVPFQEAVDKWPEDERIWVQYMRFAAVYYDLSTRLDWLIDSLERSSFGSFLLKDALAQARRIRRSRSRSVGAEIVKSFRAIDQKLKQSSILMVAFWKAVEEDASSTIYDVAQSLDNTVSFCESEFSKLIFTYPNNQTVVKKYAAYVRRINLDPFRAQRFFARADYLAKSKGLLIDIANEQALRTFPMLPPTLQKDLGSRFGSAYQSNAYATTEIEKENVEIDETMITKSSFSEMGRRVRISSINWLLIITVLCVLIPIVCGFFIGASVSTVGHNNFKNSFKMISSFGEFGLASASMTYLMYRYSLQCDNIVLSPEEIAEIIPSKYPESNFQESWFDSIAAKMDEHAHIIQENFRSITPIGGDHNAKIHELSAFPLKVLNENGQTVTYIVGILDVLNGICSSFCKWYTDKCTDLNGGLWFHYINNNLWLLLNRFSGISDVICTYMNHGLDVSMRNVMFTLILIAFAEIIFFVMFFVQSKKLTDQWSCTVKALGTTPKVAIQNAMKVDASAEDQETSDEMKHSSTLIRCMASKESYEGLPIGSIRLLMIVLVFVTIAGGVVNVVVIYSQNENLRPHPVRFSVASRFLVLVFEAMECIERIIAVGAGHGYNNDDIDTLYKSLHDILIETSNSLKDFEFGEWENVNTGFITASEDVIHYLLVNAEGAEWTKEEYIHDRMNTMPPILRINVMCELLYRGLFYQQDNTNRRTDLILAAHYAITHLLSDPFDFLLVQYSNQVDRSANIAIMWLYIIAVCVSAVGIIVGVILCAKIRNIQKVFRHCVRLVATLDPAYVVETPALMNILEGRFEEGATVTKNSEIFKVSEKVVPDIIIRLDPLFRIVYTTKQLVDHWGSQCGLYLNKSIHDLISFNHEDIMTVRRYMKSGKYQPLDLGTIKFTVIPIGKEVTASMKIFFVKLPGSRTRTILMMIKTNELLIEKKQEYNAAVSALGKKRNMAVPKRILDRVKDTKHGISNVSSVVMVGIECTGLSNLLNQESLADLNAKFEKSYNIVTECASECSDAIPWQTLGLTHFICLNMITQSSDMIMVINDALNMIRRLYAEFSSINIDIRVSMVPCKNMAACWRGPLRTRFDVYGKQVNQAHVLVMKAENNTLVTTTKTKNLITDLNVEHAREVVAGFDDTAIIIPLKDLTPES